MDNEFTIDTRVKMLLFCKWMAVCYADEHLDSENRHTSNPEFNSKDVLSVLNREDGYWYAERLKDFEKTVWQNYVKNGSAKGHEQFLKTEVTQHTRDQCVHYDEAQGRHFCLNPRTAWDSKKKRCKGVCDYFEEKLK